MDSTAYLAPSDEVAALRVRGGREGGHRPHLAFAHPPGRIIAQLKDLGPSLRFVDVQNVCVRVLRDDSVNVSTRIGS
jgi:hypothetical protein